MTVRRKTRKDGDRSSELAGQPRGHERAALAAGFDDEEKPPESRDEPVSSFEMPPANFLLGRKRTHERSSRFEDRLHPVLEIRRINSLETRRKEDDRRPLLPDRDRVRALIDAASPTADDDRPLVHVEIGREMLIHPVERSTGGFARAHDRDATAGIEGLNRAEHVESLGRIFQEEKRFGIGRMTTIEEMAFHSSPLMQRARRSESANGSSATSFDFRIPILVERGRLVGGLGDDRRA